MDTVPLAIELPDRRGLDAGSKAASTAELRLMDAYWRAANYLSVGQIYLDDNPLLRRAPDASSTSSPCCSGIGEPRRARTSSTCT